MTHGMLLDGGETDPLAAFLDRYEEGEIDDPAVARHIIERALESDLDVAILDAVTGRDAQAAALARRAGPPIPDHLSRACALMGPQGVDPHVCLAIAPLLQHVDLFAEEGPHPGAVLVWHDGFTAWTPTGAGGSSIGIQTDGSVIVEATLPQSVVESLPGRRLSEVATHPMIDGDLVIRAAAISMGRLELEVG